MNILLTGAGGAAAISVWKSLHSMHTLFMGDMDPCAAGLYLVPPSQRLILPRGDAPDYAATLLQQCIEHNIEVLIATVDAELLPLAQSHDAFTAHGIHLPLSPYLALSYCRDKLQLLNLCQETGYTPEFAVLTQETLQQWDYPCFVKPRLGSGSNGAQVLHDAAAAATLPLDGSYLIQELLSGDEYSVDVYIHSTGVPLAAVPRLRMKVDSGIAVAARTCINPALSARAVAVAQAAGIRYVANVQFKADAQGEMKLLEINPRFPGTLPLTSAAGIDIPRLLIDDVMGVVPPPGLLPFKELMVVRYWAEHYIPVTEWQELCQKI